MTQKGKQICSGIIVIAIMLAIVSLVSRGGATYEQYADILPIEVCNDIDMDGFVTDATMLPEDWDGIMSPHCPWLMGIGDCDNYEIDIFPGAMEIEGDNIDQNCDGAEIVVPAPTPVCGDAVCDEGEDSTTCLVDCPEAPAPAPTPVCGDAVCDEGEDSVNCLVDCPEAPAPTPVCGDAVCDEGEDSTTCLVDCPEAPAPAPTPVCGDAVCDEGEDSVNCLVDCPEAPAPTPVCGDAVCDEGEDNVNCPADCQL